MLYSVVCHVLSIHNGMVWSYLAKNGQDTKCSFGVAHLHFGKNKSNGYLQCQIDKTSDNFRPGDGTTKLFSKNSQPANSMN